MSAPDKNLVSFKILINGSAIDESTQVVSIQVNKRLNKIASARIKILDGSVPKETFPLSDSSSYIPGNEIEIQAGYELKTETIFKGVIIAQKIQTSLSKGSSIVLNCRDKAVSLTIGQKNSTYADMTDSDVLTKIVGNYSGLSADISSTSNEYPQIVQYYTTDWDFLLSRAEVNGMVVFTDNNKMVVGAPKTDSSSVETFTFGDNIFDFDTEMDARTQFAKVEASAWDYKNQALITASASDPSVPSQGNISGSKLAAVTNADGVQLQTTVALENADLKTWADAELLKSRLAKIRGRVKGYGNAKLTPNTIITLAGLGDRFNGDAYVSEVLHEIEDGNWWSTVTIGLDPAWFAKSVPVTARPASALLPGIRGLQNATVKQITEDPKNETRILVTVPIFADSGEASNLWCRWATPYASENIGQFFMPEIGDEVVIGFLNEDPRFPVILGSLYSSKKTPPTPAAENNPKKVIVTKSKLSVEFDDENVVLTIKTPNENKIIFSDQDQSITIQDQNENKVVMDSSGISMSSPADVKISAEGELNLSGTAGVTISSEATLSMSAEASLSVSGLEVSISGETALSASGGAEASFSADGELSISGAMVMIN
ncbi:MAG: type VI secretion system tip protein VgrG [Saprospiraceae bacterium]